MFDITTIRTGLALLRDDTINAADGETRKLKSELAGLEKIQASTAKAYAAHYQWLSDQFTKNPAFSYSTGSSSFPDDEPQSIQKKFEVLSDRMVKYSGYSRYVGLSLRHEVHKQIRRRQDALSSQRSRGERYQSLLDMLNAFQGDTISHTAAKALGIDPQVIGQAAARASREGR